MADMKVGAALMQAPSQMVAQLHVASDALKFLTDLAKGDLAGAIKDLGKLAHDLNKAQQGAQQPAPGQGMDLYALLRQILEQGKKASEANKGEGGEGADAAQGGDGAQGAEGAQDTQGAEGAQDAEKPDEGQQANNNIVGLMLQLLLEMLKMADQSKHKQAEPALAQA